jgi:ABC-type antimicrobial peptide transport system permease subunit
MVLLLWFGVCAVILAVTGVYSVITESMATREQEIAIRTALGAQRPQLVREMVTGTLLTVLIGEVLGVLGVLALARVASELFYGVSASDPFMLGSVAVFLFVASLAAALWPAWAAASRDPKASLRTS